MWLSHDWIEIGNCVSAPPSIDRDACWYVIKLQCIYYVLHQNVSNTKYDRLPTTVNVYTCVRLCMCARVCVYTNQHQRQVSTPPVDTHYTNRQWTRLGQHTFYCILNINLRESISSKRRCRWYTGVARGIITRPQYGSTRWPGRQRSATSAPMTRSDVWSPKWFVWVQPPFSPQATP